jgi:ubiquinone/menaquinone biosynthesis C-methylase UbiE
MGNQFDENYYFGNVYSNYDKFLDWQKNAKDLIKKFDFDSFLDIGCGCGNLVKEVRKLKPEVDAWGIDISEFAVKRANVNFIVLADCKNLPFENNRFDIAHILGTFSYLSNISNIKQAIKEAYRVAKKIIVFDDVYFKPDKKSDDYDPYRQRILPQGKWISLWKEIIGENDTIEMCKDEIIIKKYA